MRLEWHQLERRLEHLRVHRPERHRRLLASLAASGQQTPIVVVAAEQPKHYLIIDGYQRVAALKQLGRDTVEAVVWSLSEVEALLLDRSMRSGDHETALEEGWLLVELAQPELGIKADGAGRTASRQCATTGARGLHPGTCGDEVPSAGRAEPSGPLPAHGRGICAASVAQP